MKLKFLAMTLVLLASACGNCVTGNGRMEQVSRNVPRFSQVDVGSAISFKVTVDPLLDDETLVLEVSGESNMLSLLRTRVERDVLTVEMDCECVNMREQLTIQARLPALTGVRVHGAASLTSNLVSGDQVKVAASGAGEVEISSVKAGTLTLNVSGASRARLAGELGALHGEIGGASHVDVGELRCGEAILQVHGASHVQACVTDKIDAKASGASSIQLRCSPKEVIKDASGASSIEIE